MSEPERQYRPLSNFRGFNARLDREVWPLTTAAIEAAERAQVSKSGHLDLTDEDEPVRGNAYLRALAEDPESGLVQLQPGVYYEPK